MKALRRAVVVLLSVLASASGVCAGPAAAVFTAPPTASEERGQVKIAFAVSQPTDADVAILDAKGEVARHLAAGMLGPNAPAPFAKGALKQTLTWDRTDDDGRPVEGPVTARVRIGLGARLNRMIGQPRGFGAATGLGVGPKGEVYVLSNGGHRGCYLYVLDRNGRYLRTLLPSPASLKAGQLKGIERITMADGTELPIVYQANAMHLSPYLSGIRKQQLCVTPQGWIVFASGGNDYSDQSVPRHVLIVKPDGSTPADVGYVGPTLGPHGRYSSGLRPQQLAASPDGKTFYFAGMGQAGTKRREPKSIHAIGRLTFTSEGPEPFIGTPDEAGSEAKLNSPVSVATDAKGAVYVADAGNKRVAAFSPDGAFLGETTVERPKMVAIHPKTGALYVLTSQAGRRWAPFALIKFDKAVGGREVARLNLNGRGAVFALDGTADPARLWLSYDAGWRKPTFFRPIIDRGDSLETGEDVSKLQAATFSSPLYLAVDPKRQRLYVGDYSRQVKVVDLRTDKVSPFITASEVALDRGGNVYALSGYGTNALLRFTPEGGELPFSETGTNEITVKYRAGLPHIGVRGLTVAPNGDIYVFEERLKPEQLHVFDPDGKLKRTSIIKDAPVDSMNSVAVDRQGNIYVGINVHDPQALYPSAFKGRLPEMAWINLYDPKRSSWFAMPQRGWPPLPFSRAYLNFYLYHYGSVCKFPPEGGRFWMGGAPKSAKKNHPRPDGVPTDAEELRVGYLKRVVWGAGWRWRYRGFALNPNRTESVGDPTCSCWNGRFALDEFGRLFVPDVFRFSVGVLDGNGNELTRFGRYGNLDSAGPKSAIPEPAIPFGWANSVTVGGGKVYLADRLNRRIAVVDVTFAAEETCRLP